MKASDIIGKFRFTRTSDSGGSGGGVSDEMKASVVTLGEQLGASWSGGGYTPYPLASNNIRVSIDENNCIDTLRNAGKVTGLRILPVSFSNNILSVSEGDTVNLDLGDEASTEMLDKNRIKIAEDKSFVIYGNLTVEKFFYIPLNKSENTYTFGTPIEIAIENLPTYLTIIDSTTFAAGASGNTGISIIKLVNNSLSIERVISNRQGGLLGSIGNKLITISDYKLVVYDVTTGEQLYLDTNPEHSIIRFIIVENKVINFEPTSPFGIEINDNSIQSFECIYDKRVGSIRDYLVKKFDNNYLFICSNFETDQQFFAFIFNFTKNEISNNVIISNNILMASSDGPLLVELDDILILGYAYQTSMNIHKSEIVNDEIISLKYKNNTYVIDEIGE